MSKLPGVKIISPCDTCGGTGFIRKTISSKWEKCPKCRRDKH